MLQVQSNRWNGNPAMQKTQEERHKIAQFPRGCGALIFSVALLRQEVVFAAFA
jgi:hypothetical protein